RSPERLASCRTQAGCSCVLESISVWTSSGSGERPLIQSGFDVRLRSLFLALLTLITLLPMMAGRGVALEAVQVPLGAEALDLTDTVELYPDAGPRLQVSTAPGADGIVRRIEVNSRDDANSNWAVFALSNQSDEQIDRVIVVPFFQMVGSRLIWPDLGSSRVVSLTP